MCGALPSRLRASHRLAQVRSVRSAESDLMAEQMRPCAFASSRRTEGIAIRYPGQPADFAGNPSQRLGCLWVYRSRSVESKRDKSHWSGLCDTPPSDLRLLTLCSHTTPECWSCMRNSSRENNRSDVRISRPSCVDDCQYIRSASTLRCPVRERCKHSPVATSLSISGRRLNLESERW